MPDYPTDPDCIFCKIAEGQMPQDPAAMAKAIAKLMEQAAE